MLNSLFDRTLDYQRPHIAQDGSGGTVRSFATIGAGMPCSVTPASSSVVADYARRDMLVSVQIYTSADLNKLIPNGPQLGDRLLDSSAIYLIKGIKRSANVGVSSDVICQVDAEERLV